MAIGQACVCLVLVACLPSSFTYRSEDELEQMLVDFDEENMTQRFSQGVHAEANASIKTRPLTIRIADVAKAVKTVATKAKEVAKDNKDFASALGDVATGAGAVEKGANAYNAWREYCETRGVKTGSKRGDAELSAKVAMVELEQTWGNFVQEHNLGEILEQKGVQNKWKAFKTSVKSFYEAADALPAPEDMKDLLKREAQDVDDMCHFQWAPHANQDEIRDMIVDTYMTEDDLRENGEMQQAENPELTDEDLIEHIKDLSIRANAERLLTEKTMKEQAAALEEEQTRVALADIYCSIIAQQGLKTQEAAHRLEGWYKITEGVLSESDGEELDKMFYGKTEKYVHLNPSPLYRIRKYVADGRPAFGKEVARGVATVYGTACDTHKAGYTRLFNDAEFIKMFKKKAAKWKSVSEKVQAVRTAVTTGLQVAAFFDPSLVSAQVTTIITVAGQVTQKYADFKATRAEDAFYVSCAEQCRPNNLVIVGKPPCA